MTRKQVVLFLVVLFGLAVLVTGCRRVGDGKVCFYTAGTWTNPPAFHGNPWIDSGQGTHESFIWEPLFMYVPLTEQFIPRLGLDFTESADGKKTTIHLRHNVYWHDGTSFDALDVRSTFLVWYLQNWGEGLEGIETNGADGMPAKRLKPVRTGESGPDKEPPTILIPDDHTIVFHWFKPLSAIDRIQLLTEPIKLPHHIFGKWADAALPFIEKTRELHRLRATLPTNRTKMSGQALVLFNEIMDGKTKVRKDLYQFRPPMPVGTGPFKLSIVSASDMLLDKFERGWCIENLSVDRIRILKWPGNETIWAYLIAGQVDAVAPATPPDVAEQILKINPKMKLLTPDEFAEFGFIFNMRRLPMSDLAFRRAVAFGVDRDLVRKISYFYSQTVPDYSNGIVQSLKERWLDGEFAAQNLTRYTFDREKAVRILKDAGYTKDENGYFHHLDGKPIKLSIATQAGSSDWVLGAESLASQLDSLGFHAEVRLFEGSLYGDILNNGEFDIATEFGTDYRRFAHPAPSFARYFGEGGIIRTATGMPASATLQDGRTVSLPKQIQELFETNDRKGVKARVQHLAWLANEQLPFLTVYEKRLMIFLQDGVHVQGWPGIENPLWSTASSGLERLFVYFMTEGILKGVINTVEKSR